MIIDHPHYTPENHSLDSTSKESTADTAPYHDEIHRLIQELGKLNDPTDANRNLRIGKMAVQAFLELEQQRQKQAQQDAFYANYLVSHFAEQDPTLQSFEAAHVRNVIVDILSQRATIANDWKIHLGFHPDIRPNSIDQSTAGINFQISSILIQGNNKDAYYPF